MFNAVQRSSSSILHADTLNEFRTTIDALGSNNTHTRFLVNGTPRLQQRQPLGIIITYKFWLAYVIKKIIFRIRFQLIVNERTKMIAKLNQDFLSSSRESRNSNPKRIDISTFTIQLTAAGLLKIFCFIENLHRCYYYRYIELP